MKTSSFSYEISPNLIAQVPASRRDGSRLLVHSCETGAIEDARFSDLPLVVKNLRERTGADEILFVANDSRVYPARVRIRRATGARGEVFVLRPTGHGPWECLLRPLKKLRLGEVLFADSMADGAGSETLTPLFQVESLDPPRVSLATHGSAESVRTDANAPERLADVLARHGEMPLPPYIERDPARLAAKSVVPAPHAPHAPHAALDAQRYQTVYAGNERGSAAAPTAGLHFTPEIMRACEENGARFSFVTLHVGLGTFAPVQSDAVADHPMHEEWCVVPEALARELEEHRREREGERASGRPPRTLVVFVGTTALRAVESYFRFEGKPGVWFPTRLFLYPRESGERTLPAVGDALLTNFHQPESTLVMLVAALIGNSRWRPLYEHAMEQGYRFFSYGDSSLLLLSREAGAVCGGTAGHLAQPQPMAPKGPPEDSTP